MGGLPFPAGPSTALAEPLSARSAHKTLISRPERKPKRTLSFADTVNTAHRLSGVSFVSSAVYLAVYSAVDAPPQGANKQRAGRWSRSINRFSIRESRFEREGATQKGHTRTLQFYRIVGHRAADLLVPFPLLSLPPPFLSSLRLGRQCAHRQQSKPALSLWPSVARLRPFNRIFNRADNLGEFATFLSAFSNAAEQLFFLIRHRATGLDCIGGSIRRIRRRAVGEQIKNFLITSVDIQKTECARLA